MEELLSLKWNNHRSTFLHILTVLRDKQLYTDVTLACDGRFYSVHRLVLSTCSDYFSAIFDRTTCKNPTIVLKDIKCEDLEALLDYMYLGEVNVRQTDLASLIKAAECLRVKGLAVPDDEPPKKGSSRRPDGMSSPPAKRKRRDGQDGRDDVRPGKSSPRRKSPLPQDSVSDSNRISSPNSLQSSDSVQRTGEVNDVPFVKVEAEDNASTDLGDIYDIPNEGYKEEQDDDDDPGDMSNDLPEFLQQASGSHSQGSSSFPSDTYPGTSSFQPGDLSGWQGEGSDLTFPSSMAYGSTGDSSQNTTGGAWRSNLMTQTLNLDASDFLRGEDEVASRSKFHLSCKICGRQFYGRNQSWLLKRHKMLHTGEKPYLCPMCPYRSNQKNNLKAHFITKHTDQLK